MMIENIKIIMEVQKKIPEVFCFTHHFCLATSNQKFILPPSGQNLPTEMFHPIFES